MKIYKILIISVIMMLSANVEADAQLNKIFKFFGKKTEKVFVKKASKEVVEKSSKEVAKEYAEAAMKKSIVAKTAKSLGKKELSQQSFKRISAKGGTKVFLKEGADKLLKKNISQSLSKRVVFGSSGKEFHVVHTQVRKLQGKSISNNIKKQSRRIVSKKSVTESTSTLLKILKKGSVSEKAKAFSKLRKQYDNLPNAAAKEKWLKQLPKNVRDNILEYKKKQYNALPKKNGHWTGEPGNSIWVPDANIRPKNKNYSNVDKKNWGQIRNDHGYQNGIPYKNGEPVLKPIAECKIKYPDTEEFKNMSNTKKRAFLQDRAFEQFARQKGISVEEARAFKEKNRLVWHEADDCETLMLVPAEIHNNLTHVGGISLYNLVAKGL